MLTDGIPIRMLRPQPMQMKAKNTNKHVTVYYGEEQHLAGGFNPVNREALWLTKYSMNSTSLPSLVQSLNRIRSYGSGDGGEPMVAPKSRSDYLSYLSLPIYNSTNILAMRKGYTGNQVVSVVSNLGAKPATKATTKITLGSDSTGFSAGQNVTELLSCKTFVTDRSGNLNVDLSSDGGPRVYYPTESLNRSTNLCQDRTRASTTSSANPKSSTGDGISFFCLSWEIRTLMITAALTTHVLCVHLIF